MLNFLYFCLIIATIGFTIYMTYLLISAQRSQKKYKDAKDDFVDAVQDEYSAMLGKGEDGGVYYDWALEMLRAHNEHNLFNYNQIIEKLRKAYELLQGEDKDDAEYTLCHVLHLKYIAGNGYDRNVSGELAELYQKISEKDSSLAFYSDWTKLMTTKGIEEDNIEDLKMALELYAKVETIYSEADEEERKKIDHRGMYDGWVDTLLNLVSDHKLSEYLEPLYEKLEKRKKVILSYDLISEMDVAQYYAAKYIMFKEQPDCDKVTEICEKALSMRSMGQGRSEVYYRWAELERYIAANLKDDALMQKAEDKYQEAIDWDMNNVMAINQLATIYTNRGLNTKNEEFLVQGIELFLKSSENILYSEDPNDVDATIDAQMRSFELLIEAVKVVRIGEVLNRNTPLRKYLEKIGGRMVEIFPMKKIGYVIKGEGQLVRSVIENTFDKNKKSILKNFQKKDQKGFEGESDALDTLLKYNLAGYYAQQAGLEELVYQYMKEYIQEQNDPDGNADLLENVKADLLFANFKYSSVFAGLFSSIK